MHSKFLVVRRKSATTFLHHWVRFFTFSLNKLQVFH